MLRKIYPAALKVRCPGDRMSLVPTVAWSLVARCLVTMTLLGTIAGRAEESSPPEVIIYGGTPAGVACAVRLAREGLPVQIVSPHKKLGGLFSNGLSTMDTLYSGARAPLYDELRKSILDYYRGKYGEKSAQYEATEPSRAKTKFESKVMELLFERWVAAEPKITVRRGYYPVSTVREGSLLKEVVFSEVEGEGTFTATAQVFVDASYEGDLAAAAGVPYRVGRESKQEFQEEHAGRIFMKMAKWPPSNVDPAVLADYRKLKLIHYDRWLDIIPSVSTGEGDRSVQAYNLRTVITNDPANQVRVEMPEGYDREKMLEKLEKSIKWRPRPPEVNQPNNKSYMNMPELIGVQNAWPEGTWKDRRRIWKEHAQATLELIYFLQNDPSLSENLRKKWREWGLPRDEFGDSGHLPPEIYVREARRIKGRAIFTQNDARLSKKHQRAPIHEDAVSITEWFLDSHPCTPEKVKGSLWEGELLLNNQSYPGQISYRIMLPENLDNLLVPVCASSTHVGWGAIRLEPTWMSMAESAALGILLAHRAGVTPAEVDLDELRRTAAERGVLLAFFNDVKGRETEPWYPAVQYLGTRGFFGSYDARPDEPLTSDVASEWARATAECLRQKGDPNDRASRMVEAEKAGGSPVRFGEFLRFLAEAIGGLSVQDMALRCKSLNLSENAPLLRGDASCVIFEVLKSPSQRTD